MQSTKLLKSSSSSIVCTAYMAIKWAADIFLSEVFVLGFSVCVLHFRSFFSHFFSMFLRYCPTSHRCAILCTLCLCISFAISLFIFLTFFYFTIIILCVCVFSAFSMRLCRQICCDCCWCCGYVVVVVFKYPWRFTPLSHLAWWCRGDYWRVHTIQHMCVRVRVCMKVNKM